MPGGALPEPSACRAPIIPFPPPAQGSAWENAAPALPVYKENLRHAMPLLALGFLSYFLATVAPALWAAAMGGDELVLQTLQSMAGPILSYEKTNAAILAHLPILADVFMPLLLSLMFCYNVYTPNRAAAIHTLPYTRANMLGATFLSEITVLAPPLLFSFLLLQAMIPADEHVLTAFTSEKTALCVALWKTMGMHLLLAVFHLALASFAGILSGSAAMHMTFVVYFSALLPVSCAAVCGYLAVLAPQRAAALEALRHPLLSDLRFLFTPSWVWLRDGVGIDPRLAWWYAGMIIVLFGLTFRIHHARRFELLPHAIPIAPARFLFESSVPLLAGLLLPVALALPLASPHTIWLAAAAAILSFLTLRMAFSRVFNVLTRPALCHAASIGAFAALVLLLFRLL